jgi:catechol 2,3-dioxygenase-like lactoylglutathione lyase family enzyme
MSDAAFVESGRRNMTAFPAIGHVALTVTDLRASAAWYQRLFGAEPVLDEDAGGYHHVVFALDGGTLVGLHGHPEAPTGDRFDEVRAGLDHLAFGCADRGELEAWGQRLDELGIAHSPVVDAPYGSGLSFRDPDNIALEFFAPPA